jgi:hypothetical protein
MSEASLIPVDYAAAYAGVLSRATAALAYLEAGNNEAARQALEAVYDIRRVVEHPLMMRKPKPSDLSFLRGVREGNAP